MASACIGLGSNLDDRERNLRDALLELSTNPRISVAAVSGFHETAPAGGPPQPHFLNAAAELNTSLSPDELLAELQRIERKLGRVSDEGPWQPRRIDLDLLLYDDAVVENDRLRLPHPLMHTRLFVLVPLAEIAPHRVHPLLGKTVSELLEQAKRLPARETPCYVAISGPIAAGKTTLALQIAAQLQLVPVLERPERNPLLGPFYRDSRAYALNTQLWFLLDRARQLRRAAAFRPARFVTDYLFDQDRVFSRLNLTPEEQAIYESARALSSDTLPAPDVVVYLAGPSEPDALMNRVRARGRPFEESMRAEYMRGLCEAYDEFFAAYRSVPVIRMSCNEPMANLGGMISCP